MMDILTIAVGVGLAVSLLFSELLGLAAGGMVVPGYIALYLNRPLDVLLTVVAAVITYLIVHAFSTVVIVYGKRRTVLMILTGYLVGMLVRMVSLSSLIPAGAKIGAAPYSDYSVIGFIIPGLLAIWIDRQGLVETLSVMFTAAVVVRLVLIVFAVEGL